MLSGGRLSRRHFLGGALATTAGLALAGCKDGGDGGEPTAQPTGGANGEPKRGGTIHNATTAPILSLDPNSTEGVSVAALFYSYVVHATDWHEPDATIGDLAESWETPSEIDWVFHIRSNAVFQDVPPASGRPLVAEDIVKSIDRYRGMPGANTAWDQWTDKYETPDARTFTILNKSPYGYVLMNLGSPLTAILPIEAVEEFGDLKTHAIGSGPYMLKTYARNEGIEVVRNPTYYRDYPYVDGVSTKVIADDASVQAAFRAGSVDTYTAVDKVKADAVAGVSGTSIQKYLARTYTVFVLNAAKFEAFKDQRVREAVDLALDRKAMIDKLYFGDAELAGPVPPLWPATLPKEEIEEAYKRDVAKARQLLAAAGQENLSFSLSFGTYSNSADLASIIKSNLAEAGIIVNLQPAELGVWLADLMAGSFQSTSFGHLPYLSDYIQINTAPQQGMGAKRRGLPRR